MVDRAARSKLAEHVVHLILGARTTGQRAAAWAAFKKLYGGSIEAVSSGPGAAARLSELLFGARQREILERHIDESRLAAPDEEYGYRSALSMLAGHIDGPFDQIGDLLDDMLRNGPDPLRQLAGTILLRVGDDAWQLWPAMREALRRPTNLVIIDGKRREPIAYVVADCVRRQPARLKTVEDATWESFDPGLVAVLRDLGPLAAATSPLLALILAEPSAEGTARLCALEALGALESPVPEALDAILAAIDDQDDNIAELAMSIAARRRLDPARFVPALLERVNDTSWSNERFDPGASARAALHAYGVEPPPPPPRPAPPRPRREPTAAQAARQRDQLASIEQHLHDCMRSLEGAAEKRGRKRSGPDGIRRKPR